MRPRRLVLHWRQADYLSLEDVAAITRRATATVYRDADAGRLPVTVMTTGPRRSQRVVLPADLAVLLAAQDDGQLTLFGDPAAEDATVVPGVMA